MKPPGATDMDKYKRRICRNWETNGVCPYGEQCSCTRRTLTLPPVRPSPWSLCVPLSDAPLRCTLAVTCWQLPMVQRISFILARLADCR